MKIILLRATKSNAFLMVGGKVEGLSNLTVPNTVHTMTCFSRQYFGKTILSDQEFDYKDELFVQYIRGSDHREIQIIKQPSYDQFTKQKNIYIKDKDIWIPTFKELHKGWILPVIGY